VSWLRLDDGFDEHPKIAQLNPEDAWRWVRTLLYCGRQRRDGEVSVAVLERVLGWDEKGIGWLASIGLLDEYEVVDNSVEKKVLSYRVHDWQVYNGARTGAERVGLHRARKYGAAYTGKYKALADAVDVTERNADETAEKRPSNANYARAHGPHPHPQERSSTPTSTTDSRARGAGEEGLATGQELATARLLSALGALDDTKADYIRGAAAKLPESVTAGLLELVRAGHARDPVGYVIGALRRELGARGTPA